MAYQILLIENSISPETRTFLALSEFGRVILARSILEAVAQCGQLQPDIVVADCPMAGLGAREVLCELKDNGCEAAVVALDYHDPGQEEPGFAGILRKPLAIEELKCVVRDVLAHIRPDNRAD